MMKQTFLLSLLCSLTWGAIAQVTYPDNGAPVQVTNAYVLKNATVQVDPTTRMENAIIVVRNGFIMGIGTEATIPEDAVVYDMEGKFIYPSFFDPYSSYGFTKPQRAEWTPGPQDHSKKKGAYGWNEAIQPEIRAMESFKHDKKKVNALRKAGFGAVLTHQHNGVMRGTSVVTTLDDAKENLTILRTEAAAQLSFRKGTSRQEYPSSLMGTIALIRQTYYDAQWYADHHGEENLSLHAVNRITASGLPQVIKVNDKLTALRADRMGDEFGINYIIAGSGNEYQRAAEIKATDCNFILPLSFPKPFDVEDAYAAMNISLTDLKHWELAPSNAVILDQNEVPFAFTANGLEEVSDFLPNLRKVVQRGLAPEKALAAVTTNPAQWFGVSEKIGAIKPGMVANFLVLDGELFEDGTIQENWIQGNRHVIKRTDLVDVRGEYDLIIDGKMYDLKVKGKYEKPSGSVQVIKTVEEKDSMGVVLSTSQDTSQVDAKVMRTDHNISISFSPNDEKFTGSVRASGVINFDSGSWDGKAQLPDGSWVNWTTIRKEKHKPKDKKKGDEIAAPELGAITYPFVAYGWTEEPEVKATVIRNATVWTNEDDGILEKADVLIQDGKIAQVGANLDVSGIEGVVVVDGQGKHLTAGIVDEHTHIAGSGGINEGTQASSAEVRIGDIINSEDIDIYRQLSMGTTSAQVLHGSANPIGGQSCLIKMRWGSAPEDMKLQAKDGFIKFALGENVKQSNWGEFYNSRFPQTRMGVEQVFYDHFIRAREYGEQWDRFENLPKKEQPGALAPRKDLELEALLEILEHERFITCHSYVQSEINMLMHVADSMGFHVNTFTHILEGYKLADKMAKHGAGGSTFSDWWAYKYEVNDAIPYNAKLMADQGVVVAINSDDAEMGRRLNQEAAKCVKYGGMSQEDALKTVTLNPAKLLHIDDKVGSIKVGKDADVVLWSANPLSIYAQCEQTYIDGKCYFDLEKKAEMEAAISAERARLIQAMIDAKNGGSGTQPARWKDKRHYHCDTIHEDEEF